MRQRPLTVAALACAVVLAACSSPEAPPASPEPDPTPEASVATVESPLPDPAPPESVEEGTPEDEASQEPSEGELMQAEFDAAVAQNPEHPMFRHLMVLYGGTDFVLYPEPASGGAMNFSGGVAGPFSGHEAETDDFLVSGLMPAADVEFGEHWDKAWELDPECAERQARMEALPSGVLAAQFTCEGASPHYVLIGDQGFEADPDGYFHEQGIATVMAMVEAAGVDQVTHVHWPVDHGLALVVPEPAAALSNGETSCTWNFHPLEGIGACDDAHEGGEPFSLLEWRDTLFPSLEDAIERAVAAGGEIQTIMTLKREEDTGEPRMSIMTLTEQMKYAVDGTRLQ